MKKIFLYILVFFCPIGTCFADNAVVQKIKNTYGLNEKYDHVKPVGACYRVTKAGVSCLVDSLGNELIPMHEYYDFHWIEYTPCVIVRKDYGSPYGVYNYLKKKLIFPCAYGEIEEIDYDERSNGYIRVRQNGLYGIINVLTEEEVLSSTYKKINPITYEHTWTKCDELYFHLKSRSMYEQYSRCYNAPKKSFNVKRNGKWGTIDANGDIYIPIIYEDEPFIAASGIVCLKKNGKYGYLDATTFKPITEFKYERAGKFNNDVAQVMINGKWEMLPNPLKATVQQKSKPKGKQKAVSTYPAPSSDVDSDIPSTKQKAENTFAYIIANENYEIAKVPYALNDGWIFKQYCLQTLGIPEQNIHLFEDATAGNIIACIENLKETARAYEGESTILFYYAGHAFPDEMEHSAYLLPIDGNSQNTATAYSLKRLYKEFNSVPVKMLICFIDACFSGTTREDDMLIAGRGVAVKVKDDVPQGNTIVFTSATGAETAHSYDEKGHGMYTYFLLQKLQQSNGDVTMGELTEYVRKMVRRKSVLVNEKLQTPTVIPSPSASEWQNWKLK